MSIQILTASEMRATDERTVTEFGVPSLLLMHHAGGAVARFIQRQYPAAHNVLVLCGKGNNGGDGFVAAHALLTAGRNVQVVMLAAPEALTGDAAACFAELRPMLKYDALHIITEEAGLYRAEVRAALNNADLLVDAVLGTGFKPPMRGLQAALGDVVKKSAQPVVSVDLPSGWDADSHEMSAEGAYRSDAVVTFTAPKPAHIYGVLTQGPVLVAPIGSPEAAVLSAAPVYWAGSSKSITEAKRAEQANKGRFGHVLVVGGSVGKAGAPSMSSLAALRSGAGLVTALVPEAIAATVAGFAPELMVEAAAGAGTFSPKDLESLEKRLKGITVLAVGPGLSRAPEAAEFARGLVAATTLPMVLDADGLNAFEGQTELLTAKERTLVLTPHPGEMARLAGCTVVQVEADRLGLARRFATEHKLTLVLKGWRTLIAHPDGRVAVNTTGNAAMAKAGSGDVLTGMVAAMLAQFPTQVAEAVEAAVCLHGLAGDFAVRAQEEHTLLATDLLAHLWEAFRCRLVDADGCSWLTGISKFTGAAGE